MNKHTVGWANIVEHCADKMKSGDGRMTIKHVDEWKVENKLCGSNDYTKILGDMAETYVKKNSDYGNSFEQSLDKRGLVAAIVRMEDKMNRFDSLINKPAEVVDESLVDTLKDLANYAVMTAMWLEKRGGK